MRVLAIVFLLLPLSLIAQSIRSTPTPAAGHQSCHWCHTPTGKAAGVHQAATIAGDRSHQPSALICLGCHDGSSATIVDGGHASHLSVIAEQGLDCVTCHDPHDQTGSYRLLRGQFGPETEQSAKLRFCRGCHVNH